MEQLEATIIPVSPEPLRNRAVAVLREAIVSGRLLPGTRLVEMQLADRLGVSRGTLRRALHELEHSDLVISLPYRGTYVAEQTPNTLWDAYAVRGLLEGCAATQIQTEAVPNVVATQLDLLKQMKRALAERQSADVARIDIEFHAAICAAAGNQRLAEVWGSLSDPLQMRYACEVNTLYSPAEVIDRHEVVIALLETGDPAAIEAGIRAHYMETARRMTAAMDVSGGSIHSGADGNSEEGDAS